MREPSTEQPVGAGLPPRLRERLAAGRWLRTAHGGAPYAALSNNAGAIEAPPGLRGGVLQGRVRPTADGRLGLWHRRGGGVGGRALCVPITPLGPFLAPGLRGGGGR